MSEEENRQQENDPEEGEKAPEGVDGEKAPAEAPAKKRHTVRNTILTVVLVVVLIFICYVIAFVAPYSGARGTIDSLDDVDIDYYGEEVGGERVGLLDDGAEAYLWRMRAVSSATDEITFVVYSTEDDDYARIFFGALISKAREGVHVNVLADGKYSGLKSGSAKATGYALAAEDNIDFYLYNELNVFEPWKINALMHDKFIIVDDSLLLLGGRNLSGRYFSSTGRLGDAVHDREILVYDENPVEGGAIDEAKEYFDELATDPASRLVEAPSGSKAKKGEERADEMVEIYAEYAEEYLADDPDFYDFTVETNKVTFIHNPTNAGVKEPVIGEDIAALMESNPGDTICQTPYLILKKKHLDGFAECVSACDKVTVLTNSPGSSPNTGYTNYYVRRKKALGCGADIYEYQGTGDSIHAKSFIFGDRLTMVGSFNMDERSIYLDTESMIVVDSEEFNEILRGTVSDYMDESIMVGEDNKYVESDVEIAPFTTGKKIMVYTVGNLLRPFECIL